jgi:predicted alpha/beta-fold hydrolase
LQFLVLPDLIDYRVDIVNLFNPLPLLGNPHVQTIVGALWPGVHRPARSRKRLVVLPDGDRLVVHETAPRVAYAGNPIVLMVHGLGGTHQSANMLRMAARLNAHGWRVFRLDLRGAGAGVRHARRLYNAGCSDDIRTVVDLLAAAYPTSPLGVLGVSLGGNIVLKYAGEFADRHPPTLRAVAAVAPPIDLIRCSELIVHYPFYDRFFVNLLLGQVAQHWRHFPELPRVTFPRRLVLRQFDDLYTAPNWGYGDALDYYRRASAAPWIGSIRLPTLILTARDDPFVAVEPFEELKPADCVEVRITSHGGHVGYLGNDGAGGIRWAETQLLQWLRDRTSCLNGTPQTTNKLIIP